MSWLLDVNVLLASRWKTHADHEAVREWLDDQPEFHTSPIVELGFMRVKLDMALLSKPWAIHHAMNPLRGRI